MTQKSAYQRIGRHDAVYDDGMVKLKMTVEDFKRKDDQWSVAIYLSAVKPPLSPDEYKRVSEDIQSTVLAEGQHCVIE